MTLKRICCVVGIAGMVTASAGEIDPSQGRWLKKYQKQENAPKPGEMLLNTDAEPGLEKGFVSLLNGKDLSDWEILGGSSTFEYRDGVVTGTCVPGEASSYLSTNKDDYQDFIFTCEMKWEEDLNSGIMFRGQIDDNWDVFGPQVEMEGTTNKRGWSGGIYGQNCGGYWYPLWLKEHAKVRKSLNKEGWNRVTVMAEGKIVKTWVNGVPAAHWVGDGTFAKGYIGLQVHKAKAGKVLWRGLKVKELGEEADRLRELNAYWAEVSRAVGEGDFLAYADSCHPDGVLISGSKKKSEPLAMALKRWKTEFDQTRAGTMKASVDFRFKQRWGSSTTAHEVGMFRYAQKIGDGEERVEYIHLRALLSKKDGKWKILMENQEGCGLKEDWEELGMPEWVMGGVNERPAIRAKISDLYPRLSDFDKEGRLPNWNRVVPLVVKAVKNGIFHEGQKIVDAIRVFGNDPKYMEDWLVVTLEGSDWLFIPLELHYSRLPDSHILSHSTIGSQWHLGLQMGSELQVKEIQLKKCSPKIFTLKSIPNEDFLKSEWAKEIGLGE